MLVPVRWLKEFVHTELTTEEIAHRLTMAGLEAENISRIGVDWDNVYVGLVEKVERHPDADRLVLATVAAGEHHLTVVTGAPNIAEGQNVALALAGARLIDGYSEELKYITLKPSSIRGVRSEGMVCSEKELGLSDEHEGIMVLDGDAPVGATLREYLGDDVIEFEITPNLVHAFSVLGIARELAAIIEAPKPEVQLADLSAVSRNDALVTIEDETLCPRYALAIIENVTVQPSPSWLQRRLELAGMRPVNNVVDVSNYVMAEIGQPTHPFDADTLAEGRIVVRPGRPGERLETIDHVERELSPEMLVIADAERAVAIAGVMGGVNTEVTEATTRVLLESASFNPKSIRRTSRKLKLRSDASGRFERGVDPELAWTAIQRITQLLAEIDPGVRVTAVADAYPSPARAKCSLHAIQRDRTVARHGDSHRYGDGDSHQTGFRTRSYRVRERSGDHGLSSNVPQRCHLGGGSRRRGRAHLRLRVVAGETANRDDVTGAARAGPARRAHRAGRPGTGRPAAGPDVHDDLRRRPDRALT